MTAAPILSSVPGFAKYEAETYASSAIAVTATLVKAP
jgi:hypothetical protein